MGRSCAGRSTALRKGARFWRWSTSSSAASSKARWPDEEGPADYGWVVPRQPRPGRMGMYSAARQTQQGNVRLRAANHQQSHGADGGYRRVGRAEGALPRGDRDRFGVREEWHHHLDSRLEAQELDYVREEAGGESRFVGRSRSPGRVAPDRMGLDQRPRLARR